MPYSSKEKQKEYDHQRNKHRQAYFQKQYQNRKSYLKAYYQEHKEQYKARNKKRRIALREYGRNHALTIGTQRISGVFKRPYTGYCELCGKVFDGENRKLAYHHWDDSDVKPGKKVKGIWVCEKCHRVCDMVERKELYIIQRYLKLKRMMNRKCKIQEKIKPELN